MKSSTINLDLSNVQPESDSIFSKVPAGAYAVSLAYSQFKEGKSEGACGLQIGFMIESGEHKGKMIADYINIQNKSEDAVKIGHQRLRKICDLQNRKSLKLAKDTDLIARAQFMIDVEVEESTYNDKPTTNCRVKKLYAAEGQISDNVKTAAKENKPKTTSAPVEQEEQKESSPSKLPWE